ncbi:hypothetical protein MASR2M36_34170 [Providencia sp.]
MEADIIANAGQAGAVTIATNMAGRGTDIMLGGSWQTEVALEEPTQEQIDEIKANWKVRHDAVLAAGGLHIIGTERHESRRIDNQLRGRAGRQGDAGSSRFYLSMEDALMRIFASDRVTGMMKKLSMKPGEAMSIHGQLKRLLMHNVKLKAVTLIFVNNYLNTMMLLVTNVVPSILQRNELLEVVISRKLLIVFVKTYSQPQWMLIFRLNH